MKRAVTGLLVTALLVAMGLCAVIALQPSTTHIERTAEIAAPPAVVFPLVDDMAAFARWNPWRELDPTTVVDLSPQTRGVGAWYAWTGEKLGKGRMTVTASHADDRLDAHLGFREPFEVDAHVTFTLAPTTTGTTVVWKYDTVNTLPVKAAGLFVDLDTALGADFERGLARLSAEAVAARNAAPPAPAPEPQRPDVSPTGPSVPGSATDPRAASGTTTPPGGDPG